MTYSSSDPNNFCTITGLERWASIKLRQSGEETCDSARHVVRISKLLNEKDFCERYRAVSRASEVFASLMGTADALAIQRAEQKQEQLSKIQHIGSIEKMSCFVPIFPKGVFSP